MGPSSALNAYGKWLAHRNVHVMVAMGLFTLIATAGVLNLTMNSNMGELYTPVGNRATSDKAAFVELFGNNDVAPASFVLANADGSSVMTSDTLQLALDLHDEIMAIVVDDPIPPPTPTSTPPPQLAVTNVCLKLPTGACYVNTVLACSGFTVPEPLFISYPACADSIGIPYMTASTLGAATVDDTGYAVEAAQSLRFDYILQATNATELARASAWEAVFGDTVRLFAASHADSVTVSFFTSTEVFADALQQSNADMPLFAIAFLLFITMLAVLTLACSRGAGGVHTRGAAVLVGIIAMNMANMATIGICSAMGIAFNPVCMLFPFLVVVNMLETVLMLNRAFTRGDARSTAKRLGRALQDTASPLLATLLVQFAVLVGAIVMSPTPALTAFATYCAVGIVMNTLYQLTLYSAVLAADGRREAKGKHAWLLCCKPAATDMHATRRVKGPLPTFKQPAPPAGGPASNTLVVQDLDQDPDAASTCTAASDAASPTNNKEDDQRSAAATADIPVVATYKTKAAATATTSSKFSLCQRLRQPKTGSATSNDGSSLCSNPVALLLKPVSKCCILLVLATLLALAGIGISLLQDGLDLTPMLTPQSPVAQFLATDAAQYNSVGLPHYVVLAAPHAPYWEPEVQQALGDVVSQLGASDAVAAFPPVDSWLVSMLAYLAAAEMTPATTEAEFIQQLFGFLMQPQFARYRLDLVLVRATDGTPYALTETAFADGVVIRASRITFFSTPAHTTTQQRHLMADTRRIVDAVTPLAVTPAFVHQQMFELIEQQEVAMPLLLRCIGVLSVAMVVVNTAFMNRAVSAFLSCLGTGVAVLVVMGAFHFLALAVNHVTFAPALMALLVCIGPSMYFASATGSRSVLRKRFSSTLDVPTGSEADAVTAMTPEVQQAAQGGAAGEQPQASVGGVKAVCGRVSMVCGRLVGGSERRVRTVLAMRAVAPATVVASLAAVSGFLVMAVCGSSYFTRSIGGLMAVALMAALVQATLVLPVLASWVGPSGVARFNVQQPRKVIGGGANGRVVNVRQQQRQSPV